MRPSPHTHAKPVVLQAPKAKGVWHGPAPTGSGKAPTYASDARPDPASSQAQVVTLPGGAHMPLLGIGTYKLADPAALEVALDGARQGWRKGEPWGGEAGHWVGMHATSC